MAKKSLSQKLLQSKLTPPIIRRELVVRPRLIERLQSARYAKLILLNIPPGFGKTTLIAQYMGHLHEQGVATAWLTLDDADNDPARFFTYLIAALQKSNADLDVDRTPSEFAYSAYSGHSTGGVLLYTLDYLAAFPDPITIVLDDFSVINSPEVLNSVKQLLLHLPPGKRLILMLRQEPNFGIERLRAQGEVFELKLKDLQFTLEETTQFIRQTQGLNLSEDDIEYIHHMTEGWAAGLQLSSLSSIWQENRVAKQNVGSWAFGNIYSYLAEEVLARQPQDIQSFLLETSILKRLTGPICDAVTGKTNSYEILDYLEKANIFLIPLDADHCWYRYHSIFALFLQNHLARWERKRLAALHRAASNWLSGNGEILEAVDHSILAGDMKEAASLLENCAFDLVKNGQTLTIVTWCQRLPVAIFRQYPELQLAYTYALIIQHRFTEAIDSLDKLDSGTTLSEAEASFQFDAMTLRSLALFIQDKHDQCEQVNELALSRLKAAKSEKQPQFLPILFHVTAAMRIAVGRFEEAKEYIWKAARISGQPTGVMMLMNKALEQMVDTIQGRLNETLASTRAVLDETATNPSRYSGGGAAIAILCAEALYQKNEVSAAEKLLISYHTIFPATVPDLIIMGLKTLARIRFAYGDITGAIRYLSEMERMGAEQGINRISAAARQERIRMAIQQGELDRAMQISREHDDQSVWTSFAKYNFFLGSDPETPEITQIRLLIARGQAKKALEHLKDELTRATSVGCFRRSLLLHLLSAKALLADSEKRQALRRLREALIMAQGEGYIRIIIDEGEPLLKMIRELYKFAAAKETSDKHNLSLTYLEKLLEAIGDAAPQPLDKTMDPNVAGPEPLTRREIDILEKAALGLSNEKIADRLCVSVHTARFHLRNIYWKMGAHNRTEAVAMARSLGLIK